MKLVRGEPDHTASPFWDQTFIDTGGSRSAKTEPIQKGTRRMEMHYTAKEIRAAARYHWPRFRTMCICGHQAKSKTALVNHIIGELPQFAE